MKSGSRPAGMVHRTGSVTSVVSAGIDRKRKETRVFVVTTLIGSVASKAQKRVVKHAR